MPNPDEKIRAVFQQWADFHHMTGASGPISFGVLESDKRAVAAIRQLIDDEVLRELETVKKAIVVDMVKPIKYLNPRIAELAARRESHD